MASQTMWRRIFFAFLCSSPLWASPQNSKPVFTPAKVCGECHVAIYEGWKGSMHANAVTDPVFYPIFLETSRQTGGKSDVLCLSCHAPTARGNGANLLDDPSAREGVSCDFCHRIRDVRLNASPRFVLETGKKKWGPLKGISSPFHEVGDSPLFEQAKLCAGCHEYANERGVPILETFSEWKESSFGREGKACQTCHMPPIAGMPVPPRVKPVKEIYINSHEAVGGHSVEQVRKAIVVEVEKPVRSGDKVHGVVRLTNAGSGHKVPTGIPTRRLVLELRARSGGIGVYAEDRVYQKTLVNEAGEAITRDADVFLHAAKVKADNRLKPGETRIEHFTFYAPKNRPLEVEAAVYYLYQPRLIQETEMKVELGRGHTAIPPE